MDFRRIVAIGPVTVDFLDGAGDDLVISCASIGHDATRAPSPEFVATAIGKGTPAFPRRALFVSDASRSWAQAPAFGHALQQALALVAGERPVARICTIGLSMGAYAALAACHYLPVQAALAFGPQFSVLPDIVPEETRWTDWTRGLQAPLFPTAPLPAPPTWSVICHGLQDDMIQARRFPRKEGVDHVFFPDRSHTDLVPYLKTRGVLAGLTESLVTGDRVRLLRIASSAGGKLRHKLGL